MTAYSFRPQFAPKILAGTKRQTIRAVGKRRHARPGEELQLYTGMRTRECRLIARVTCFDVCPIRMDLGLGWIGYGGVAILATFELDGFACADGFDNWRAMKQFWRHEYGAINEFEGVLITWRPIC